MTKITLLALHALLLVGVALTAGACGEGAVVPSDTPDCVAKLADDMQSAPVENPPSSITEYEYKGAAVYFIPGACCDGVSSVIDDKCATICSPGGGIDGKGDGKCPDFSTVAQQTRIIWQDNRK